jgi:small conductance mechanosensitive channel
VDNKVIFVPNGSMSNAVVTNYSPMDTRRVDWTFGVEYGEDFDRVRGVLLRLIQADSRILQTPEPFVELGELADSSVNITVRVWVKSADYWAVYFDMNRTVYATFNKEGIGFPYPHLTIDQAK